MVDRAIFLDRLAEEVSNLKTMSDDLQGALHNLPLAASDQGTRTVLQSADKLTQSLTCLHAALHGLSDLPLATRSYDLTHVLRDVFLEDMRERLVNGEMSDEGRTPPGEVDLF